jgi:hypothetical protein
VVCNTSEDITYLPTYRDFRPGDLFVITNSGTPPKWSAILLHADSTHVYCRYNDNGKKIHWNLAAVHRCMRDGEMLWYPVKP